MSRILSITVLLAALGGFAVNQMSRVQADDKKPAAPSAEQMAEMQKVWEAHATPGNEHKELAKMVGNWDAEVEDYSMGTPQKTTGTAKRTMILGGRFLQEEFKGTFAGMAYEGFMLIGYDNTEKKLNTVWLDTMSTGMAVTKEAEGSTAKKSVMTGTMTCPLTKKPTTLRTVTKNIDDNKMEFELHGTPPGAEKEVLMLKIIYTRSK